MNPEREAGYNHKNYGESKFSVGPCKLLHGDGDKSINPFGDHTQQYETDGDIKKRFFT